MPDQPTRAEERTPDVPEDLLASAVRAWSDNGPGRPGNWSAEQQVRAILAAVLPEHTRQVREQVARELLAVDPAEWALAGARAGQDAARIARGEAR